MGGPSVRDSPARSSAARVLGPVARVAIVTILLAPLALAVAGSTRPVGTSPPTAIELLPDRASSSNYELLAASTSFRRQVVNSLLVAALAVPIGTLVASMAGFAIARLPRRGAVTLIAIAVTAATIPATTLFIGRLALFRAVELTDTPVPLVAPALLGMTPLAVLLFAWASHTLPREVFDLARESGLGPFGTWWRIAVPLRAGAAAVVAALAFVVSWGNMLDPLLYVYDERWFTVPIGIASLAELPPTDHGLLLAGAVLAVAPVLAAVVLAQRVVARGRW